MSITIGTGHQRALSYCLLAHPAAGFHFSFMTP